MAKKKKEEVEFKRIPVEELEEGGVYRSYVKDLMKILEINHQTKQVKAYNISGAHRQWIEFKYINMVERIN